MLTDLRYAIRSLSRTPGFTLLVVATLGVGIGVNTAMFSVVHAVLLQPFPYPGAESILRIQAGTSHPDLLDLTEQARSFASFGAFRTQMFDYSTGAEAERLDGALVTAPALTLFGATTLTGRLLSPADHRPNAACAAVVSAEFWRTRLASSPDAVGRTMTLSEEPCTIVGVLAPGFSLPATRAAIIAPFSPAVGREFTARGAHTLRAFGRLAPGVTMAAAQEELDALASRLAREYPQSNTGVRFVLHPLREDVAGGVRQPLMVLLATVAFVLLIACVNVANLLFARVAARQSEFAVRAAIGATRGRIVRQVLTESFILAAAGGMLGLAIAASLTNLIVGLAPQDVPRLDAVAVNSPVLVFAVVASLGTGLLFGTLPAWTSAAASIADAARAGARGTRGGNRLRSALLVAEVALAFVLLAGAGLLLRSFAALVSQEPGFETANLLTGNVTLNGPRYATAVSRARFWEQAEERIRALPGVHDLALTSDLPIGGSPVFHNLVFEGRPVPVGSEPEVYYRSVNGAFFRALGIAVLSGRTFTSGDREGAPLVAVVNDAFVRRYYPGEAVLGKRVRWASGDGTWITIVGVVADVRGLSLDQAEVPAVHMPIAQEVNPWRRWMDIAVRTRGDAGQLAPALRRGLGAVDRNVPVARIRLMDEVIAASVADRRFSLILLGSFSFVALLLAAAGTYGVMTYLVTQRTREVGVRLALGATPADVFKLIVGRGVGLTAAGILVGLLSAAVLTEVLQALLFGIGRFDPLTLGTTIVVLLLAAAGASCPPALRASRLDPLLALRSE